VLAIIAPVGRLCWWLVIVRRHSARCQSQVQTFFDMDLNSSRLRCINFDPADCTQVVTTGGVPLVSSTKQPRFPGFW
jgi:hypothetical protein